MPKISTMCKGMTGFMALPNTAPCFLHKHVDKTCFDLAVSTGLSQRFINKFSWQKDFKEAGDIHIREEHLLNKKISRPDKQMFLALKYNY